MSKIRSLAARRDPEVAIEVHLADVADGPPLWRYAFGLRQEARGHRETYLTHERVWKGDQLILNRPDKDDNKDQDRLTQTFLEQVNVNADFREVVRFLQSVTYLHPVLKLLRFADSIQGRVLEDDPFGQGFLERVARANERTRRSRLSKIEEALKIAVPQLEQLEFTRDAVTGRPHLQALYSHWRPNMVCPTLQAVAALGAMHLVTTEEGGWWNSSLLTLGRGAYLRQEALKTVRAILDNAHVIMRPQTHESFMRGLYFYGHHASDGLSLRC